RPVLHGRVPGEVLGVDGQDSPVRRKRTTVSVGLIGMRHRSSSRRHSYVVADLEPAGKEGGRVPEESRSGVTDATFAVDRSRYVFRLTTSRRVGTSSTRIRLRPARTPQDARSLRAAVMVLRDAP